MAYGAVLGQQAQSGNIPIQSVELTLEGTWEIEGSGASYNTLTATKMGSFVTINGEVYNLTASVGSIIAILPEGFRPLTLYPRNGTVYIDTDGNIKSATPDKTVAINITYALV